MKCNLLYIACGYCKDFYDGGCMYVMCLKSAMDDAFVECYSSVLEADLED